MGKNVNDPDREIVVDYADGSSFLRLHLDIPLPRELTDRVRACLDGGDALTAIALITEHAGSGVEPYLRLFFQKDIAASQYLDAAE
ncbi:MAG: hypothetical protein Q8O19_05605 [Rectinemataceae bacterium]|jgi:hypothetical protein|nr:hypothetical protein [Rectinemataceae bacterium]